MPFFLQNRFFAILMLISGGNQSKEEELVKNADFFFSPAVIRGLISKRQICASPCMESINPPRCFFSYARSTNSKEKIKGP